MRFEDYVEEYRTLKFQIRRTWIKEQEIRELEGFSPSSGEGGMPHSKQNTSTVEKMTVKLNEILSERKSLEQKLMVVREQISRLIDRLDNYSAQEVIETKVFVPNCGWKYISKKVFLGEKRVAQLYKEGVAEINSYLREHE